MPIWVAAKGMRIAPSKGLINLPVSDSGLHLSVRAA